MSYSREQIESATTPEQLSALLAGSSQPRWSVTSLADVAEFFRIAVSTAKGWSAEGMPSSAAGWPLDQICQWRLARQTNSDLAVEKKRAELEAIRLGNDSKRLDLAKERGELLDRSDVERWASIALIEARETIMSLPELLATSAPPELRDFVRAETDRHCRSVLTALRRRLESDELHKATDSVVGGDESTPTIEEPSNEPDE